MSEDKDQKQTPKSNPAVRIGLGLWRTACWLLVIAIVLTVAYISLMNVRGKRAATQMLYELKDRNIMPARSPDLPHAENAAHYYLAAGELLARNPPELKSVPYISSTEWPNFGEQLTPDQVQLLNQALAASTSLTEILDQIKPGDRAQFELDATTDMPHLLDVIRKSRNLTRWYRLNALQATAEGDTERAVHACLAILQLSRQLAEDDYQIVALVRMSIAAHGMETIESLLSRATLTESQLQTLQDALIETRSSLDYQSVLRHELSTVPITLIDPDRHIVQTMYQLKKLTRSIQKTFEADSEVSFENDLFNTSSRKWANQASSVTFASWCPGKTQISVVESTSRLLEHYDTVTDPATGPARLTEISQQKVHDRHLQNILVALRVHLKIKSGLTAAIAALEVEKYRLREGDWPDSLADVFDVTPTCPYGHPIHMARRDHEVRVYSIGINGTDDAGINQLDEDSVTHEEDDRTFVLLNPDQRNRPASKETVPDPKGDPTEPPAE